MSLILPDVTRLTIKLDDQYRSTIDPWDPRFSIEIKLVELVKLAAQLPELRKVKLDSITELQAKQSAARFVETLIEFRNQSPPISEPEAVEDRKEISRFEVICDRYYRSTIDPWSPTEQVEFTLHELSCLFGSRYSATRFIEILFDLRNTYSSIQQMQALCHVVTKSEHPPTAAFVPPPIQPDQPPEEGQQEPVQ